MVIYRTCYLLRILFSMWRLSLQIIIGRSTCRLKRCLRCLRKRWNRHRHRKFVRCSMITLTGRIIRIFSSMRCWRLVMRTLIFAGSSLMLWLKVPQAWETFPKVDNYTLKLTVIQRTVSVSNDFSNNHPILPIPTI